MAKNRKRNRRGAVVAVVSDTHINSTVGLPPGLSFPLDDGNMNLASPSQAWLWHAWEDYWKLVAKAARRRPLYVVINGDAVDGDHHETRQIITRNKTTQMQMACHVLEPIAQHADYLFFTRGTRVHVGHSASGEEAIAADLDAIQDNGRSSWWWLPLEVEGVRFDIAHHTTKGRRPWTKGNAANRLAAHTIMQYADRRETPPDVVIRSHVHIYEKSENHRSIMAIISPGWQLQTEYGSRIAPGDFPDIGGLIFVCKDGQYEFEEVLYPIKRREWWTDT